MIGIIGGSGIYDSEILNNKEVRKVHTPFGAVEVTMGTFKGKDIVFLARHGTGHSTPPHLINYRANIWALKSIGVNRILSTSASGSLNVSIPPGSYVVLSNFLDFTKSRANTFYDGEQSSITEKEVVHIDVTEPYCPTLRGLLISMGKKRKLNIIENGVYVCTEGPRFETSSEIGMFSKLGGDVVGMTNVPEVVLSRELEICYSSVAMVTNYAAGISKVRLTHREVLDIVKKNRTDIKNLFREVIPIIPEERNCDCVKLLDGAKG